MHITFDPAVPLLGIQPREMPAEELREAWRRNRKQLNVEYYAALQKDEVGLHCGDISGTFGEGRRNRVTEPDVQFAFSFG